jgi:protein gp37
MKQQQPPHNHTTWNPYVGCRKISPGCAHCYMFRDQEKWGRDPALIRRTSEKTFQAPLHLKTPHTIFTCSWSDFFLEEADEWREDVWEIIRRTPQHLYQVLTKRPERILQSLPPDWGSGWPNVWLGVTTENQAMADRRLPIFLQVPAGLRWVVAEPLLGPLDLRSYLQPATDSARNSGSPAGVGWVVTGAESGPSARPLDEDWVRNLRDQCLSVQVPFYYKQNLVQGRRVRSPRLDGQVWDQSPLWLGPETSPAQPDNGSRAVGAARAQQLSLFE